MSEQPQTPEAGGDPEGDDLPAVVGPDAPTLAHPTEPATEFARTSEPQPAASEPETVVSEPVPVVPEPVPVEPLSPAAPAPPVPPVVPAYTPPPPFDTSSGDGAPTGGLAAAADRPEVKVGAAFAGGLVLALILKRLAR